MRKIIVLEFVSLDGVIQSPGAPREDNSGGFTYGGWTVPYFDDFSGMEQFGSSERRRGVGHKTPQRTGWP